MPLLRLLPTVFALLLLGAHFLHHGPLYLVPLCVALAALVFVRLPWMPRLLTGVLVLATAEWLRTLYVLAGERIAAGQPHLRLIVILGAVAVVTLLAAWPLRSAAVRRWYDDSAAARTR